MPFSDQLLIWEAGLWLLMAKLAILLIGFKRTASWLGHPRALIEPDRPTFPESGPKRLGKYIQKTAKHVPWDSKCLVQAIAGQLMLKVRRLPGTIYFGVNKENGQMKAHAWLRSGSTILTGGQQKKQYTLVGVIGRP